jgi:hypothetical protein
LASTYVQTQDKENIKTGMGITQVLKEKLKRDKMYPEDLRIGS